MLKRLSIVMILFEILLLASIAAAGNPASLNLTKGETAWLKDHPVIRVAPDPFFPPIEWIDSSGNFSGLAADYIAEIEQLLKVEFHIVRCATWSEVLQKARDHEVDMLSAAAQSTERSQYLLFTKPHIILPGVLIGREKTNNRISLEHLSGKKLCIVSGYVWQEYIHNDYPEIIIAPVPDVQTGMRNVAFGSAEAVIENLATATWYIDQEGITNLAVKGETPYSTYLSFAVRDDWPAFKTILEKALSSIPTSRKEEIKNNWIRLNVVSASEMKLLWIALITTVLLTCGIIAFIWGWGSTLKKRVHDRTLALQRELTERQRIERALLASEGKYRELVESVSSVILKLDTKGTILFINGYALDLFGYTAEELIGRNVTGTIVPEQDSDGRELPPLLNDVFTHPEKHLYNENENMRRDGTRLWLAWANRPIYDSTGKLIEVLCVGNDITGRRQAEQALTESERRYRYLFEESPSVSIVISFDYIVKDVNHTLTTMLQYDKAEMIGRPGTDFVEFNQRKDVKDRLKMRFTGETPDHFETRAIARDGSLHTILFSRGHSLYNENGKPTGILLTGIDITDRKRTEMLLKEQERNLVQADKMATLGILVSGVAHEINNPNNYILLNSENLSTIWQHVHPLVEEKVAEDPSRDIAGMQWSELQVEISRMLHGITDGAGRIETIIKNLKDFARQGSSRMDELVCVNEVINSSLIIMSNLIKKSTHNFSVKYCNNIPDIRGNFQQIEQVFLNLLSNACQALTDPSQSICVETEYRDEKVVIIIHDQGKGIDQENLPHVFDPFFTTKRDSGGTGLGLSITYSILKDHQGTITVDSVPENGTTITVNLPAIT